MKISEFLKKEGCIMELKAAKKEDAIREIGLKLSATTKKIKDPERFIKDILDRESLGSTGIGHRVAIPHARSEALEGFSIGFGRSSKGIDFSSFDRDTALFIFLMGANPNELNLYLSLLAELSKLVMQNSFRMQLLEAKNADEIIALFKKFEAELKD